MSVLRVRRVPSRMTFGQSLPAMIVLSYPAVMNSLSAQSPRGRCAPSAAGPIHVGNARTALAAWLSVRSRGGTFLWRLEDIDTPRVVPGMAEAQQADLAWLGLDWDEGPYIQ